MKKFKIKKVVIMFLIIALFATSMAFPTYAESPESIYEEKHEQIEFENLDVSLTDNDDLCISINSSANLFKKFSAKKQSAKLKKFLEKYPAAEEEFKNSVKNNQPTAVMSYTEVPIIEVDGHFERVKKQSPNLLASIFAINASAVSCTEPSRKGYFALYTSIDRESYNSSLGNYNYKVRSTGIWEKNSSLSGSSYPAGGADYLVQSVPKSMLIVDDIFVSYYTNGNYGGSGWDYSKTGAGNQYLKYDIVDDPIGIAQLMNFTLASTCQGKAQPSITRKIYSKYVHTWTSMTASLEIGISDDLSTQINISPSIIEKSWTVTNYVSFNL